MLTLYTLTGLAFAALVYARCTWTDMDAQDRLETVIASVAACIGWPVVLGLMVWREFKGE